MVGNGICSSISGDGGGVEVVFLDIGGDGGLVVVVMIVTTVFKGGSFYMEELFIFILCVVFVVLVKTANSCSCTM